MRCCLASLELSFNAARPRPTKAQIKGRRCIKGPGYKAEREIPEKNSHPCREIERARLPHAGGVKQ